MLNDKKVAFLFPGQGNIPKTLISSRIGKHLFSIAEQNGLLLRELVQDDQLDLLSQTQYAQPMILIDSLIREEKLRDRGLTPAVVAGHSLGEYAALVSAGVLTAKDALCTVIERARLMAAIKGGMVAVLKLPIVDVRSICQSVRGDVVIANYNAPEQAVISGGKAALRQATKLVEQMGGRAIPLRVSGAFHSSAAVEAEKKLAPTIGKLSFATPLIPVISSVSGDPECDGVRLKKLLLTQITSCVRWVDVINSMTREGVSYGVEAGTSGVLPSLGRQITSQIKFFSFEEALHGRI